MSNNISLVGRLGSEPELKTVGNYTVLEFNLANNCGFGEKQVTNWFRCTIWGTRGEKLKEYLSKGKEVFVTGELSLRKYTNKEGVEKISPDLKVEQLDFIGGKSEGSGGGTKPSQTETTQTTPESESDLPF